MKNSEFITRIWHFITYQSELIKLSLLAIIAVCLIIIVIQGYGGGTQDVYVRGGYVDVGGSVDIDNTVDIRGSVDVDNTVDISGSVDVDNTVSVSIDEVLGKDGYKYYYNNY